MGWTSGFHTVTAGSGWRTFSVAGPLLLLQLLAMPRVLQLQLAPVALVPVTRMAGYRPLSLKRAPASRRRAQGD